MRLYDELRAFDGDFPDCVLLVGDEVADMIDAMPTLENEEETAFPPSFYGCVSPPFPLFFVESRKIYNKRDLIEISKIDARYIEVVRAGIASLVIERGMLCEDMSDDRRAKQGRHLKEGGAPLPAGTKWILRFTGYSRQNRVLSMHAGRAFIHLDQDGQILDDMKRVHTTTFKEDEYDPRIDYLSPAALAKQLVFTLKTIGLLHEKAEIEEVKPKLSRQARRLAKRQGKPEPKPFYLLKVRERATKRVTVGDIAHSDADAAKRAHQVRGHFRVYGQAGRGLLFGKYEKTVWVPSHVRGDKEQGEIEKGYEIKPEKEQSDAS